MLTKLDLKQLEERGITPQQVEGYMRMFREGFPFLPIERPATVGDGIISLEDDEVDDLVEMYKDFQGSKVKFVPASGAATRMFKHLFEFRDEYPVKGLECFNDKGFNSAYSFFQNIKRFPFYDKLYNELWSVGYRLESLLEKKDYLPVVNSLLDSNGLNYGSLPKALIHFHRYGEIARTALEEHLVEAAKYARDQHGVANLHFTVSPEHLKGFQELVERVKSFYENHYEVTLNVAYSVQKPTTDTLAVDLENNPFRNPDGSLHFRPGGHGALIENLNELNEDIIFIKNIDNVTPDHLKAATIRYKKALAGLLVSYKNLVNGYIERLLNEPVSEEQLALMLEFTTDELCILPPANLNRQNRDAVKKYLMEILDRPIRVCGMVKNQGEPGGGPFWAKNPDGTTSLQIVEQSQVDMGNPRVKEIFGRSTHFNPVDIACSIRNYKGEKFNLSNFLDPQAGFISIKSKNGKQLKALELPGLWNGAMSRWITFFVEVPIATFTPVKTVNDLLRSEHQPE